VLSQCVLYRSSIDVKELSSLLIAHPPPSDLYLLYLLTLVTNEWVLSYMDTLRFIIICLIRAALCACFTEKFDLKDSLDDHAGQPKVSEHATAFHAEGNATKVSL
jgi:hypothetical protein